jgi:hypothetical protein
MVRREPVMPDANLSQSMSHAIRSAHYLGTPEGPVDSLPLRLPFHQPTAADWPQGQLDCLIVMPNQSNDVPEVGAHPLHSIGWVG